MSGNGADQAKTPDCERHGEVPGKGPIYEVWADEAGEVFVTRSNGEELCTHVWRRGQWLRIFSEREIQRRRDEFLRADRRLREALHANASTAP